MGDAKESSHDVWLAALLALGGGVLVMVALQQHWNPNEMNPGVEGSLTMVGLTPIFGLLHGLSYRDMLKVFAPILGIEFLVCRAANVAVLPVMGIALIITGFVGFLRSLRAPAEAALVRAPAPRRPRPAVSTSPRLAH